MGEVKGLHARKTYNQWIRKTTRYHHNCPKAHSLAVRALVYRDEGYYVRSEGLLAEAKAVWYDSYLKHLNRGRASNYGKQGVKHAIKKLQKKQTKPMSNTKEKPDYSVFTYQGLHNEKIKVEAQLVKTQQELERIDKFMQVKKTLEIAKNLQVVNRTNRSANSSSITVSCPNGYNKCKVYHGDVSFAHQITLIPEMLKIVQRVAEGDYTFKFQNQAEELLKNASGVTVTWEKIGEEQHKVKSYGKTKIYKLVQATEEEQSESSLPVSSRSFPF